MTVDGHSAIIILDHDYIEIIRLLLKIPHIVDVNFPDFNEDMTPLQLAFKYRKLNVAKLLLEKYPEQINYERKILTKRIGHSN